MSQFQLNPLSLLARRQKKPSQSLRRRILYMKPLSASLLRNQGVRFQRFAVTALLIAVCFCSCVKHVSLKENANAIEPEPFSVVLLPDTQLYSEKYPDTYKKQTQWIADNIEEQKIKFVIHLGDIVQNHNEKENEWRIARDAHKILDGVVPYSVAPGNHDMDVEKRDTSLFHQYFPASDYQDNEWYGGNYQGKNDNNYTFFESAGMRFMIVNLEYNPRDEVLEWANEIVKQHKTSRVIVATHQYLRPAGRDKVGQRIWDQFVRKHANIFMVVCGHVGALTLQNSLNDTGGTVYEILTDYQSMHEGGDGWLRTLEFHPSEDVIAVGEYSPVLEKNRREILHTYRLFYPMLGN